VTKDGAKMSKSKGNVVDPNVIVDKYGSDAARVFILFTSPPERDLEWSDEGVVGASRFIDRVYRLVMRFAESLKNEPVAKADKIGESAQSLRRICHKTIEGITSDIEERIGLNTSIAKIMEMVNEMYRFTEIDTINKCDFPVFRESVEALLRLLSPFAPHICDELYETIGGEGFVLDQEWPKHNPKFLQSDTMLMVVQINGKVRGKVTVASDADKDVVWEAALKEEQIARWLEDKEPKKVIYVPKKLMNIVI
jgi:leucyl-tRNA synthetase